MTTFVNSSYPRYPEGEYVTGLDFENIYFQNGNKKITHFSLYGQFPTPKEYMINEIGMINIDDEINYVFVDEHKTSSSTTLQKPVNTGWVK